MYLTERANKHTNSIAERDPTGILSGLERHELVGLEDVGGLCQVTVTLMAAKVNTIEISRRQRELEF